METEDLRKRPLHNFYELVQTLRVSAMARYEMERAKGTPDEQLAAKMKPLLDQLELAQNEAAHTDFDGYCHAIIQLELDAEALADHAQYLLEKAGDCRTHADKLRNTLQGSMERKGESMHRGLFHSAAIIEVLGKGAAKGKKNLIVR